MEKWINHGDLLGNHGCVKLKNGMSVDLQTVMWLTGCGWW